MTVDELLNDVACNVYLEHLNETCGAKAVIAATYFYAKLTDGGYSHKAVARWTKRKPLFACQ